jgi:hypothetical protein
MTAPVSRRACIVVVNGGQLQRCLPQGAQQGMGSGIQWPRRVASAGKCSVRWRSACNDHTDTEQASAVDRCWLPTKNRFVPPKRGSVLPIEQSRGELALLFGGHYEAFLTGYRRQAAKALLSFLDRHLAVGPQRSMTR